MPLSDSKVKNAKPRENNYLLFDGNRLFLLVRPSGAKYWRYKYRFGGKEKALALGVYPEISLADARARRDAAKKQLAHGIDPATTIKAMKAAKVAEAEGTLETIAREWYAAKSTAWSESHKETVIGRLELDVFPRLGAHPIGQITAPELLRMLRAIESRGALETAHRVRTICGQVFRYAIATGRADRDPAADLRDALRPYKKGHLAAITDPKELAPLLRAIDAYKGTHVVKSALQLTPMLLARPGELRRMEWAEVDLDAAEWRIPGEKMKSGQPHIVPLPWQGVAILRELRELTGRGQYAFPAHGRPAQPMSEAAVAAALHTMGFKGKQTAHGFRATARTILDEVLQQRIEHVEHQLAHSVRDPLGRAYNRTQHIEERRNMLQLWADYLDMLRVGAKVIPLRREHV